MIRNFLFLSLVLAIIGFTSCKPDELPEPPAEAKRTLWSLPVDHRNLIEMDQQGNLISIIESDAAQRVTQQYSILHGPTEIAWISQFGGGLSSEIFEIRNKEVYRSYIADNSLGFDQADDRSIYTYANNQLIKIDRISGFHNMDTNNRFVSNSTYQYESENLQSRLFQGGPGLILVNGSESFHYGSLPCVVNVHDFKSHFLKYKPKNLPTASFYFNGLGGPKGVYTEYHYFYQTDSENRVIDMITQQIRKPNGAGNSDTTYTRSQYSYLIR